jgi:hypothetical protein
MKTRGDGTNECGFGFRRTTHDDDDTTTHDDDDDACDDEFRVFIIVVIDDAVGRDRARVDGGRRRWGKKRRETVWREKTRKTRDARRRKDDGVGGFDGRGGDEK